MKAPVLELTSSLRKILELAELSAAEYLSHESKLLLALIEVDRAKAYRCFGYTHLTPYCRQELNLSEDIAAVFVRVVRKSLEIPELAQAVAKGEIQLTKAKSIASVITKENKAEWLAKASSESKQELEKAVLKASGRETKTVTFELTPEELENFRRVQDLLCAKLDHFPSKEETLSWMTGLALTKIDHVRKADRSRDRSRRRRSSTARKNEPRAITVKDQVTSRDRGRCQAQLGSGEICGSSKWTHQHHVIPRALGGADTAANLISLCASHHRAVHAQLRRGRPSFLDRPRT